MRRAGRLYLTTMAVGIAVGMAAAGARADTIGARLGELEQEVVGLAQGIQRPDLSQRTPGEQANRRLIDAQVSFGTGNYDDAAVMLYEYVEKYPQSRSYDVALYYLAEALFQKGDYLASRTYFTRLVRDQGPASKFYQQGLERLIELSVKLRDSGEVDAWLAALDRVPPGQRRPSVPYVRGKYAYFAERYDEAMQHFGSVPAGTEYALQARYFSGACLVARGDLDGAVQRYTALIAHKPTTPADKRVIELAHLALGRLYYEMDQPSKAVDQYLEVERKSDLFDQALFEITWVYVKNRQFDKALRALELLALSDPSSSQMPAVKILEGNLRIRRAQSLTLTDQGNSAEEYAKAVNIFERTHDSFAQPFEDLQRVVADSADPRSFMAQITGRASETFDVQIPLPEIAAAWMREEPEVQHLMNIELDLGEIAGEIAQTEQTIERLEQALASPSRVNIFPSLAQKRTRATEIAEELLDIRQQLVAREMALLDRQAGEADRARLRALAGRRDALARQIAALPGAGISYSKRIEQARSAFVALDQRAAEIATVIDTTEATLVALERYLADRGQDGDEVPNAELIRKSIRDLRVEVDAMRTELDQVRRAALLAKDEAGTGDDVALRGRALRAELRMVLDQEQALADGIFARLGGSRQRTGAALVQHIRQADRIARRIDDIDGAIREVVDFALGEVRVALDEEKAHLAAYRREFDIYEAESRELGGVILGTSLSRVRDKFYDVLMRSEVGVIDVAWSQKEDIDETVQKLGLDKLREMRTLHDQFRDILEEEADEAARQNPNAPADAPAATPADAPAATPDATPDGQQGRTEDRP